MKTEAMTVGELYARLKELMKQGCEDYPLWIAYPSSTGVIQADIVFASEDDETVELVVEA